MQFYINYLRAICEFECSKDSNILLINIRIEHVLSPFNLNRYMVLFFILGTRLIKKYKQGGGGIQIDDNLNQWGGGGVMLLTFHISSISFLVSLLSLHDNSIFY